jgi:hypothetical protein
MIHDREAIKLDELVPSIWIVGLANPVQQVMIRRVAAHTNGSEVSLTLTIPTIETQDSSLSAVSILC